MMDAVVIDETFDQGNPMQFLDMTFSDRSLLDATID